MKLSDWPAFQSLAGPSSWKFHCERAVHGKAHGAGSDYRWLAASPGFRSLETAERLTRVGQPDLILPFSAWAVRTLNEGPICYAVCYLESRAEDAFGRHGFLERHFWEWSPPQGKPYSCAAAALALLPRAVEEAQAGVYDRGQAARWQDPQFRVALEASSVEAKANDLEAMAEAGRQWITAQVSSALLGNFYESLLAGTAAPAILPGAKEPLDAAALATLLLVFEKGFNYDSRSICGWIPTQFALDLNFLKHWNALVTSRPAKNPLVPPLPGSQAASLVSLMRNERKTDPDVIKLLEFAANGERRREPPAREFRLTSEEQEIVNNAALNLSRVSQTPPAYLESAHPRVKEAYKTHMRLKLGAFCAAVLVIDPAHQAVDIDIEDEMKRVLNEWSGSALARQRLKDFFPG